MKNEEVLNQAEQILGRKLRCIVPFEQIQFFANGAVYPCCPAMLKNNYSLGNIFEKNYTEIWFSEKAQAFRQSVLDGSYKFCNLDSCVTVNNLHIYSKHNVPEEVWNETINRKMPKEVHLNIDTACNARCIMCRDEKCFDNSDSEKYMAMIDDFLPLLAKAEFVYLNGSGELFASKLCRTLVKKITSLYPKIKFNIITNGILSNKENIEDLGLNGKLLTVEVSMHAATKETYDKIVRDGDYEKVLENLKYFSELKKSGELEFFWMNYVVSSYNYKEMADFQRLAEKLGAMTNFWEYRPWENTEMSKHYDEVAIFEPGHPDYEKYLEIIKNDIFKSPNCNINAKLRPFVN